MSIGLILCLLLFAITAYFYPQLPETLPIHWNIKGEVDGYADKSFWVAFMYPLIAFGSWALFIALPKLSPQKYRMDQFMPIVGILQLVMTVFFCIIGLILLYSMLNTESNFNMSNVVIIMVGLLLVLTGNYLSKVRKNFFIGIRTPWTLASDEVWDRTHRIGAWTFVIGGLLLMLQPFFKSHIYGLAVVSGLVLIPVVYSFILYKKLEGFTPEPKED